MVLVPGAAPVATCQGDANSMDNRLIAATGGEDTSSQISAALAQLARADRVVKVEEGVRQKASNA